MKIHSGFSYIVFTKFRLILIMDPKIDLINFKLISLEAPLVTIAAAGVLGYIVTDLTLTLTLTLVSLDGAVDCESSVMWTHLSP